MKRTGIGIIFATLGLMFATTSSAGDSVVDDVEPPRMTAQQRSSEKAALRRIDEGRRMLAMGQTRRARDLFKSVIKSVELNFGPMDLRLVEPLRGIASSHELERKNLGQAVEALQRIVDVYATQGEQISYKERVFAYVQLADLALITRKVDRAHKVYRSAWQELAAAGTDKDADAYFEEPETLVFFPPPYMPGKSPESNPVIKVSMTLDRQGKARQVSFGEIPETLQRISRNVKRSLAKAVFRPRIVGGDVIDNDQRTVHIEYSRTGGLPTVRF